jgi:hypothetical protein
MKSSPQTDAVLNTMVTAQAALRNAAEELRKAHQVFTRLNWNAFVGTTEEALASVSILVKMVDVFIDAEASNGR